VNTAVKLEDAYCLDCDEDELYMDVKEEPSVYKVGAICHGCDRDYGVLESVPRNEIDHLDELWAEAEEVVRRYMD
jgi:hypothetical protein